MGKLIKWWKRPELQIPRLSLPVKGSLNLTPAPGRRRNRFLKREQHHKTKHDPRIWRSRRLHLCGNVSECSWYATRCVTYTVLMCVVVTSKLSDPIAATIAALIGPQGFVTVYYRAAEINAVLQATLEGEPCLHRMTGQRGTSVLAVGDFIPPSSVSALKLSVYFLFPDSSAPAELRTALTSAKHQIFTGSRKTWPAAHYYKFVKIKRLCRVTIHWPRTWFSLCP